MAQIYDSSHSGQEIDAAVDAVQTTIPQQLTTIGSKIGDLANLQTTDKTSAVAAINEIKSTVDGLSPNAVDINYADNQSLGSTNVQGALDAAAFKLNETYANLSAVKSSFEDIFGEIESGGGGEGESTVIGSYGNGYKGIPYTATADKQAYGQVGGSISFGDLEGFSYIKIERGSVDLIRFKTHGTSRLLSYIQYVDAQDHIISLDMTTYTLNTWYDYTPAFPVGATALYITSPNSASLYIEQETADVSPLIDNSYSYKYIKATPDAVGSPVSVSSYAPGNNCLTLRIPLEGVKSITYPLFLTTEVWGSVICNAGGVVVWAYANTLEPYGYPKTVDIASINDASYMLVSISRVVDESNYPALLYTVVVSDTEGGGGEDEDKVIPSFIKDDYLRNDRDKSLSLFGAKNMYNTLRQLVEDIASGITVEAKGNSSRYGFNDFGEMPSCSDSAQNPFLADGTDSNGDALIKYSDVIAKYDVLVERYPSYVTKTSLGYDASGTIPMYYYTFTPKWYTQSIYLQAGIHGWEPDPVFALAEIAYLISNAYGTSDTTEPYCPDNSVLKWLRGNVKITINPVANPWGFNNREDCDVDTKGSALRTKAQNNYNNVQLNSTSALNGNQAEATYIRTIIEGIQSELSFAIDMHSTVWKTSRTKYGCFYGVFNQEGANSSTIFRTYEWLYEFYNVKYPYIVQGDTVPNMLDNTYSSIGYGTTGFNHWILQKYGIQGSTMEFSDHVWSERLHTSEALSVAVNMYLNQIIQQLNDEYKKVSPTIDSSDWHPAKG